ncbi:SDR family NAD(P)-dependent oxidoreductase [Rubinisphaera sp. JC750]|uniref:SDR family NAD(P)-dependent oxidoreductase n=1 Tax=Rubinisphaera sp. JC750 TaxID=2898658 RepID=UPI001F25BCAA|nr:SDR family oxidoreductase [Rubinisphaera sp. JC750]
MSAATIVFGASGSVGSSLCEELQSDGRAVLAVGRDAGKLDALKEQLGVETAMATLDQPDTIAAAFDQATEIFGQVEAVANCIGTLQLKPAHLLSDEDWQDTIAANLTSCFQILKASVKAMRSQGGAVVFVSTAAAEMGMANHEAIAAAKAGVLGLMRSAAATYANRNLRVNCVSPGLVKSNMSRHLWEDEKMRAISEQMNPLGRLGEPADIARMIAWLLHPQNSWVTGQNFGVDGGLSRLMQRPKTKV